MRECARAGARRRGPPASIPFEFEGNSGIPFEGNSKGTRKVLEVLRVVSGTACNVTSCNCCRSVVCQSGHSRPWFICVYSGAVCNVFCWSITMLSCVLEAGEQTNMHRLTQRQNMELAGQDLESIICQHGARNCRAVPRSVARASQRCSRLGARRVQHVAPPAPRHHGRQGRHRIVALPPPAGRS